jgi:DNA-binding transcriptional LysR family regulator
METKHIRAAVTVAHYGTFSEAARALFMAQSTLSRQVATLERDVGGPLFVRGSRRVELTRRGKAFLPEAELIMAAVERAERAAKDA